MLQNFLDKRDVLRDVLSRLYTPVDIASVVFVRIAFGLIMFWEVWRYYSYGWIDRYFIEPVYHFKYLGFEWVKVLPKEGMYLYFFFLGFLALCIALGFFYRLSSFLFFLSFTYLFLLEKAYYLNHFYLICLLSFLMIFIPANRSFSLDAYFFSKIHSDWIPAWAVYLLRFQVAIPYVFGGIAKLTPDWLQGYPLRFWLLGNPLFETISRLTSQTFAAYFFSYGGLFFDLLIVPALLWKKTRENAFLIAVMFHMTNAYFFHIGIFPWMMIALTTIYLTPSWPRNLLDLKKVKQPLQRKVVIDLKKKVFLSFLTIYILLQIFIPFRHFLYPGIVHWNEYGHKFAWHMKLRSKKGDIRFFIVDFLGKKREVDLSIYLTYNQIEKMATHPEMIIEFAHYLSDMFKQKYGKPVKVYVESFVSLNGRKKKRFVNPYIDLASKKKYAFTYDWILPLNED